MLKNFIWFDEGLKDIFTWLSLISVPFINNHTYISSKYKTINVSAQPFSKKHEKIMIFFFILINRRSHSYHFHICNWGYNFASHILKKVALEQACVQCFLSKKQTAVLCYITFMYIIVYDLSIFENISKAPSIPLILKN